MHQADLLGGGNGAGDGESHRLFFALLPEAPLRDRIHETAVQLQRGHAPGGRRTDPERYHLTLQFLGDFQPLRQSVLDAAIAAAGSVRLPAFDLVLDRAGSFRGPRVGWLGSDSMPSGLQALWDGLAIALGRARVQVKSGATFNPHVTVLREVREPLPAMPIEPLRWRVREFVLMDSVLGPHRAYRPLGRWSLAGGASGHEPD